MRDRLSELRTFFDRAAEEWQGRRFDLTLARSLLVEAGVSEGQAVLDLGTGTGHYLPVIRNILGPSGDILGLDLSGEMLKRCCSAPGTRAHLACGATEALPLKSSAWDAALCIGLYPHFADRVASLTEIARVLRSNGTIVILHLIGRQRLNALHREIGGTIADDLLPGDPQVRASLERAGFTVDHIADEPGWYRAVGRRR